jgi:hypothetical protein
MILAKRTQSKSAPIGPGAVRNATHYYYGRDQLLLALLALRRCEAVHAGRRVMSANERFEILGFGAKVLTGRD